MGSSALNIAVENFFKTAWGSTTSVRYDNIPFTPVEGASWVSLTVRDGKSEKASIGPGVQLRRTLGTVFVDIFTPVNQGTKPIRELCDTIKGVFRDQQFSGITFYEGSETIFGERYYTNSGTGNPATGQQMQALVSIPFVYQEYI